MSRIAIHRSFWRDVAQRSHSLDGVVAKTVGHVRSAARPCPLLCLEPRSSGVGDEHKEAVLLSAGVHGDEPAGVHAALDFLEAAPAELRDHFAFFVLPCVNPSGYEANTLESVSGANLNRLFQRDSQQPEVRMIERWLASAGRSFRATFDLHEVPPYYRGEGFGEKDNPDGCYLYETASPGLERLGPAMIASLPEEATVCHWPTIYGDINTGGVIAYPDACRNPVYAQGTTFDGFLNGRHTKHSFTTETPSTWDFELRVKTHVTLLRSALSGIRGGLARETVSP